MDSSVVTAFTTAVTPTTLYAQLAPIVPLIATGILVGLGLTFGRKVVHGLGKGKGKF